MSGLTAIKNKYSSSVNNWRRQVAYKRKSILRPQVLLAAGTALCALMAQPLLAQGHASDEAAEASSDTNIVVTGTRIKGIAPVGSAVITVTQDDSLKSGTGSTKDFLNKIPQVLSSGISEGSSGGSGTNSSVNSGYSNSVNLRGLGPAATLSLVNNHRMPAMGPNSDVFEPDAIPSLAIQGIEIIPDGSSAIYGSDAVTGVVNFITRDPFKRRIRSYGPCWLR